MQPRISDDDTHIDALMKSLETNKQDFEVLISEYAPEGKKADIVRMFRLIIEQEHGLAAIRGVAENERILRMLRLRGFNS